MEIKVLTNITELCKSIYREQRQTLKPEEIYDLIGKHFVLGYEVWENGKLTGWAYSLKINGVYTLDGVNEGCSIFSASKAGKLVAKEILCGYSDALLTIHKEGDKNLDALAKRVGFKWWVDQEGSSKFILVKEWLK